MSLLPLLQEVGKLDLVETSTEEIFVISGSGHTLYSLQSLEDASEYLADLLRVGGRVGVYSFTYYSMAYIDLTELGLERVRVQGSEVELVLPPIRIEPMGRSVTLKQLHERVTGTKAPITNQERLEMQNRASEISKERLAPGTSAYNRVVAQAEERALAFFKGYLHSRGYDRVVVRIETREKL